MESATIACRNTNPAASGTNHKDETTVTMHAEHAKQSMQSNDFKIHCCACSHTAGDFISMLLISLIKTPKQEDNHQ